MSSAPRIFISGAAGFLGSHLADRLLERGCHVMGCDNFSLGRRENIPKDVEFYEYDVLDLEENKKRTKGADAVFHAAAWPYDNFSLHAPFKAAEQNFSATASFLSAAIQNNVRRFVFCSSMARYGNSPSPFSEDMPPRPVTPYGVSKAAGESLVQSMAQAHGFEHVIAIPHNIFGPRQVYHDPFRNAVSIIINRMLRDKPPVIFGDGEQKRSFSPVQDAALLLEECLFSERAAGEVINIGPDHENLISLNELAAMLNQIMGKSLDPAHAPARCGEVRLASCSAEKSRRLFGRRPLKPLREALEELAAYIEAQGPKDFCYGRQPEIQSRIFPEVYKSQAL